MVDEVHMLCVEKRSGKCIPQGTVTDATKLARTRGSLLPLFMGACCRLDGLVSRIAKLKTKVNLSTATDTGRTLLHACAASGSVKCLDIIIKHLMALSLDSLENVDVNKESARQLAERLGHNDVAERLLQYKNTKLIQEESCRASEDTVEDVSDTSRSSSSPHQRQANRDRKINSEAISNERVVEKTKHNEQSDAKEDINSDGSEKHEGTTTISTKCEETLITNEGSECIWTEKQEEAQKISDMPVNGLISSRAFDSTQLRESDTDRAIKPTSPTRASSTKRRVNEQNISNASTIVPGISIGNESSEDDESEQRTRLPSLGPRASLTGHSLDGGDKVFQVQHRPGRKLVFRSMSTPNSPEMSPVVSPRNSPTSEVSPALADVITDTRSAPNSPLGRRSLKTTFRAVGMTARFAVGTYANLPNSPVTRARVSREPLALATPNVGNAGIKFDRFRRGSLAVGNDAMKIPAYRGKSR